MNTETKGYNLTTTVNDFELNYNDVGEGKTPIIFLHGYPFNKSMWQEQLNFLKPWYRCISCDIRGFGKSTDQKSPLSIDLFAEDLMAFMDQLNVDKAIICGLSMGGFIALNTINKFPERFAALILCDTQCIADTKAVKEKRYGIIEDIEANGVTKFNEAFVKSVFCKETFNNKKELVKSLHNIVFSNSKHIIIQGMLALAQRAETCSTLDEITLPTLIICGREDEVTPLAESEFMHATIQESVLKVIENAGHVSNLEQPDEFNKHLLDFLSDLKEMHANKLTANESVV